MAGAHEHGLQDTQVPSSSVEVGAGFGDFGKRFYPHCYLTDRDKALLQGAPALDVICDANGVSFTGGLFNRVIMCNPYHYGFADKELASDLLAGFLRVLQSEGEIIIIGHLNNKYCHPNRVQRTVAAFNKANQMNMEVEVKSIVAAEAYPGHAFYDCGRRRIHPNLRIRIRV